MLNKTVWAVDTHASIAKIIIIFIIITNLTSI